MISTSFCNNALAAFLIGIVVTGCAPKPPKVSTPRFDPFTQNWMLLADPISGSGMDLLGAAYSLEDGDRFSNCYAFRQDSIRSSFDSIVMEWDESREGSAFFGLVKLLSLQADVQQMGRGLIKLDSVKIIEVTSVTPAPSQCLATTSNGMPKFPAIRALVGVKAFTSFAQNKQRVNATAKLLQPLKGKEAEFGFQQQKGDSAVFSFGALRWIGAKFVGFDPVTGPENAYVIALGKREKIEVPALEQGAQPNRFDVVVETSERGFEVRSGRTGRMASAMVSKQVEENEVFPLARAESLEEVRAAGFYPAAWVERHASADSVKLHARIQGFNRIAFVGEGRREELRRWIISRQ
jgi:hypothetical protein